MLRGAAVREQRWNCPARLRSRSIRRQRGADSRAIDDLIDELITVRCATKVLFNSFDEQALQATGISCEYEISVLAMGFAIIGHQVHHLKIIEERYYPLLEQSFDGNLRSESVQIV